MIAKSKNRLEELILLNDIDFEKVLGWAFEEDSYLKKINETLNSCKSKLIELGKVDSAQFDNLQKKREEFLVEIEKLCKEEEITDEQVNDKLTVELRSGETNNYRELIEKEVYSLEKLEKWKDRLAKIIRQIKLEKKRRITVSRGDFNLNELNEIQKELDEINYHDIEDSKKIITKRKVDEDWEDYKIEFEVRESILTDRGAKRTIIKDGNKLEEVADKTLAEKWYETSGELIELGFNTLSTAKKSLEAWQNGWNYYSEEYFFGRKDLPYHKKRVDLGAWVHYFEKVAREKGKKIKSKEIVEWWENLMETGLNEQKSAEAWGNGWKFKQIRGGRGSITPNITGTFNIPVDQEKSLARQKEQAKIELVSFFRSFSISKEEQENKSKIAFYKNGINEAIQSESIQKLLQDYFKEIAHNQINYALNNSPLKKSDLSMKSQNDIVALNDNVSHDIEDIQWVRNNVLGEIGRTRSSLNFKKEMMEDFIRQIKNRLELASKNNWKITLEKINEKEWDDYIRELDARSNENVTYREVSDDLLVKFQKEVAKVDNEGKNWEPNFNSEDWEKIKVSFLYENFFIRVGISEGINAEEKGADIVNMKSAVAAVKKLAINKWKRKIEEKIDLAKKEKTDEEASQLINELDSITQWDKEKDGSNQKQALQDKREEVYSCLELLKYNFYFSTIKKIQTLSEISEVKEQIRSKMSGKYLPLEKKLSDLHQALNNQEALINLKIITNDKTIPTEINEVEEQLDKLLIHTTEAQKYAYNELNKDGTVDKKELELIKVKHLKVNDKGKEWKYELTNEYKELISHSKNKDELLVSLRNIEKCFQFRTDFYNITKITSSLENDQLIDEYRKLGFIRSSGKQAGLIYEDGWKDPKAINEQGFASLNGGGRWLSLWGKKY